ncbi:MAG: PDZ domain-containing protein [Planctomycetaceae bacterium]|jgi:serine protease Do|nr:PDZ domain-containing protein [Planctomycetaceae bacterium]MBT6156569.1 PDZ domain-containing protein [Planctomycetaceae bacterium]MBT6483825.1 PDZ domain-containing protein [Planctomycetaceae bacterium]MBT6496704.1 PDZ domain-containing protein [Planctomycetaceae bacterium]
MKIIFVARMLLAVAMLTAAPRMLAAQSAGETIKSVMPRMVKIFGAGGIRQLHAYGTGTLVSAEGHIITVWSHVLDTDEVTVVLANGRRLEAKVLGAEPQLDLAVIKLQEDDLDLPFFDLANATSASPGTRILGFSNMFKVATGDEPVSVLHGVISARTRLTARRGAYQVPYDGDVYVVDAITNNPGAGGGIITSVDGKLLGMIGKELRNAESNTWINYAVPIPEIRKVVGEIISGQYVREEKSDEEDNPERYNPFDFGLVMIPDVLYRTPAYITSVVPNTAADEAGIQPDDLIVFANDELIQSNRMLKRELGRLEGGDTLRIIVKRGATLVTLEFPVQKKPGS